MFNIPTLTSSLLIVSDRPMPTGVCLSVKGIEQSQDICVYYQALVVWPRARAVPRRILVLQQLGRVLFVQENQKKQKVHHKQKRTKKQNSVQSPCSRGAARQVGVHTKYALYSFTSKPRVKLLCRVILRPSPASFPSNPTALPLWLRPVIRHPSEWVETPCHRQRHPA